MSRVLLAVALLATTAFAEAARAGPDGRGASDERGVSDGRGASDERHASDERDAPAAHDTSGATPAPGRTARHAFYVEMLGKAGLWGVGYDWQPRPWLALGAAASYYSFDGDRVTTLAPYVAGYPIARGRHRGFLQLGPSLAYRTTPSPVAEWDGMTTTRISAALCAGYEYRHGVLLRLYAMASRNDHLVPWVGASVGWTL
jgi:hypothetical protein